MFCASFMSLVFFRLLMKNCAFKVKNMKYERKLEKVSSKYDRVHHPTLERKCARL
jgi:hypothetical protein